MMTMVEIMQMEMLIYDDWWKVVMVEQMVMLVMILVVVIAVTLRVVLFIKDCLKEMVLLMVTE